MIVFKLIICCLQRFREPGAGYPGDLRPRQERVKKHEQMAWVLMTQSCGGCVQSRGQIQGVVKHTYPDAAVNTLQLLRVSQEPSLLCDTHRNA